MAWSCGCRRASTKLRPFPDWPKATIGWRFGRDVGVRANLQTNAFMGPGLLALPSPGNGCVSFGAQRRAETRGFASKVDTICADCSAPDAYARVSVIGCIGPVAGDVSLQEASPPMACWSALITQIPGACSKRLQIRRLLRSMRYATGGRPWVCPSLRGAFS